MVCKNGCFWACKGLGFNFNVCDGRQIQDKFNKNGLQVFARIRTPPPKPESYFLSQIENRYYVTKIYYP